MEGFEGSSEVLAGFGEASSSSESEWSEEEMSSSSEEALVEELDFGLPEMVIFLHEPIYAICKEARRVDELPPARCSRKCHSEDNLVSLERVAGESEMPCCRASAEQCGCKSLRNDGCSDEEERYENGIVSYDEHANVYKKVVFVRDVEEVIQHSPRQRASKCTRMSNQVQVANKANMELLDKEVDVCAVNESFYFDSGSEKDFITGLNFGPGDEVKKLVSLKELMSMTSLVDHAGSTVLSPPPMAYSMHKSYPDGDLGQACSSRQSFSFPILAKEWFGSPERMAENSSKFPLHGLIRYFRCCSF
uniref:Uncharacterized protein n=1 Tax=Kalanchoe fedtschenkoi TaxID=63787 RepID=A0A7N1A3T2_KALFE